MHPIQRRTPQKAGFSSPFLGAKAADEARLGARHAASESPALGTKEHKKVTCCSCLPPTPPSAVPPPSERHTEWMSIELLVTVQLMTLVMVCGGPVPPPLPSLLVGVSRSLDAFPLCNLSVAGGCQPMRYNVFQMSVTRDWTCQAIDRHSLALSCSSSPVPTPPHQRAPRTPSMRWRAGGGVT